MGVTRRVHGCCPPQGGQHLNGRIRAQANALPPPAQLDQFAGDVAYPAAPSQCSPPRAAHAQEPRFGESATPDVVPLVVRGVTQCAGRSACVTRKSRESSASRRARSRSKLTSCPARLRARPLTHTEFTFDVSMLQTAVPTGSMTGAA